jgi:hypothetical protein
MASLRKYERRMQKRDDIPTMVKQLSRSLESLAELTYHQLPFARADQEAVDAYKTRIRAYFEKLTALEKELMQLLPDDDQRDLARAFAEVDLMCRECMLEMENVGDEPTQEELLAHYQAEEDKFEKLANDLD